MKQLVHTVGFIEGLSAFVLFCIAMPMKHVWQSIGKEEFFAVGLIHGLLWVLYALVATVALVRNVITWKQWLILGAFSLLPLGPIIADRWVLKDRNPASGSASGSRDFNASRNRPPDGRPLAAEPH